jgi:DNA-binding XRE family transcriptional regulator
MPARPITDEQRETRSALKVDVGQRLRRLRRVLDLNQKDFGKRAGLASNTYNQIELGEKLPSVETAIAICEAFNISLDYIFRGHPGDMSARLWECIKALENAEHND